MCATASDVYLNHTRTQYTFYYSIVWFVDMDETTVLSSVLFYIWSLMHTKSHTIQLFSVSVNYFATKFFLNSFVLMCKVE